MTASFLSTEHSSQPTPWKRASPFIAAFIVIASIAALTITLWARNSSEWNDFAPEEEIIEFLAGQNFATHGFLSRGFLTDNSLDDAMAYGFEVPPIRYTHQPPGPALIIGGLISIGFDDLPKVRLAMIVFFLVGLIAVMAFFWRLFTPWHGIAVVALLGLNGRGVLPWADHTTHAYWLGLSGLTLWAISHPRERSFALWVAAVAVFLVSWINYIQLIVLLITLAGLWLIRLPNFTFRRVLILYAVAAGGVVLHIIQNVIVIGPEVAFQDILYTFGNRMFAQPSREALRAFSQQNDLILWGVGSATNAVSGLAWIWSEYFYFGIPLLLSLVGLVALAVLRRLPSSFLALRLLAVFAVSSVSFHLALPAAGQAYPFPFALALPIAMVGGLFLGELVFAWRHHIFPRLLSSGPLAFLRRPSSHVLGELRSAGASSLWHNRLLLFLVALAVVSTWQTASLGLRNLEPETTLPGVAELQILKDFQGEGFWTNITPHQVGYYTRSWVIGQMSLEGFKQRDITQAYVIPVSRKSYTWNAVDNPRYFFFAQHNVTGFLPDTGPRLEEYRRFLAENYPVVAWSPYGSMVVDLSQPTDPAKRVKGSQQFDISPYARIPLESSQVEVSSINDPTQGKTNLVKPGIGDFWHVKAPREEAPAWVMVDLGEKLPVSLLRVRPRVGVPQNMWDGPRAMLEASDDKLGWTLLAPLVLDRAALRDDWVYFPLPSTQRYRYFRLSIWDVSYFSMARLELYAPAGTPLPSPTPTPAPQPPLVPQGPVTDGVQQFDLSKDERVTLTEVQLSVSKSLDTAMGKANLIQPGTVWHLESPRADPIAWVAIDLGEKLPVSLLRLRLRARTGYTSQMWDSYTARFQASDNGRDWTNVATLGIDRARLQDDWIYFPLSSPQEHRYFQLMVWDMSFVTLAGLELYVPLGTSKRVKGSQQFDISPYARIPLESSQVEVSSINDPTQGKTNLIQPGTGGFWHVKAPREEAPAWVMVDLGEKLPVSLLRVRPRVGVPQNMWDGPRAMLEASDDKLGWTLLAPLVLDRAALRDDWVYFPLPSTQRYRYFRLSIWDVSYFSMARLELYRAKEGEQ